MKLFLLVQSEIPDPGALDPGFQEWFTFISTCVIIFGIYLIKARFSSRKNQSYLRTTEEHEADSH